MTGKLSHRPNRAIKHPFKFLLLGVFIFFGLLFTNEAVLGATPFDDNFDTYTIGQTLDGQGNWTAGSNIWVVDGDFCRKNKCVKQTFDSSQTIEKEGATTTIGNWNWSGKLGSINRVNLPFEMRAYSSDVKLIWKILFYYWTGSEFTDKIVLSSGPSDFVVLIDNPEIDNWYSFSCGWDLSSGDPDERKIRCKVDSGDFTSWLEPKDKLGTDVKKFTHNLYLLNDGIDEIGEFESCGLYQSWLPCQNAGCCWYYFHLFYQNVCVECPTGECESGPDTCSNCLTEINCEAEDLCYWFEGICKFGTGSCGEGLELSFCENQEDCEIAGGYWYDDFCWLSAPVSLTSWEDYYTEYGDYATSSAWISNMASNTSLFLGQMGGFLAIFENNFDLREAFERGKNFGEAIPIARGYLKIFDDFLGGFPIGEFFTFLLIFMLAVGVFRIMRNLFQLIKFW